ncbi:MAG: hypothetical protein WBG86_16470, partial [Polyangiales bacterium]
MSFSKLSWCALVTACVLTAGCGDDSGGGSGGGGAGGTSGTGGAGGQGGVVPPPALDCDPLTPSYCGFPYPNDYWTAEDATTVTGRQLTLPQVIMPQNMNGVQSTPGAFNEADGFSPGIAAMTLLPGATTTGLATSVMIESSLLPDARTVILNAATGERVPHWVEIDEYVVEAKKRVDAAEDRPDFDIDRGLAELEQERAFMVRPAVRLEDATRYIVAIRGVLDGEGAMIPASPAFAALRDDEATSDPIVESRRGHFEELFSSLAAEGIARDDLQIAWDFTT